MDIFKGQIYGQSPRVKLDALDRKILDILMQNARLSDTFIAKQLNTSREVVTYRIKRLTTSNFLYGYITVIDVRKIGLQNYIVALKLSAIKDLKSFIPELEKESSITRIQECTGTYDLQIFFTAQTQDEFYKYLRRFIATHNDAIQDYTILTMLAESFTGLGILTEKTQPLQKKEQRGSAFQKEFSKSIKPYRVDAKDREILRILAINARASLAEIAKKVALSPPAIKERVAQMVRARIITHFLPVVALANLGYQWFLVFVRVKNISEQTMASYCKKEPNILWYIKTLGGWHYQLSFYCKSNAELKESINKMRMQFKNEIITYETLIVFNQYKFLQKTS